MKNKEQENDKGSLNLDGLEEFFESIRKITEKAAEVAGGFSQAIANIEFPKFDLPKFNIPVIDFERIRKVTENNSKYGWTLTGEMALVDYLNDELLTMEIREIDSYFFSLYNLKDSELNFDFYKSTKTSILESINPKWIELLDECFTCHAMGMYKTAIPNLLLIIEGEISEVANSNFVGGKLLDHWKRGIDTERDQFDAISIYSLYLFLREVLYKSRDFQKGRLEVINRNWVLHGRDDPINWRVEDYFRLINTLSSIQFVKDILKI